MKRVLLLLVVVSRGHCVPEGCAAPRDSAARITVSSYRNETGQWSPQVHLQKPVSSAEKTSGLWKLDVGQKVVKCGDSEIINIYINLTAPTTYDTDYELYPGSGSYKLHTRSVTWEEAREICESEGAHLAIVNSDAEAAALRKLIRKFPSTGDWIYIGFHDKDVEGQYVTVLGEPLKETGYFAWAENEPNSLGGNEDCGTISRQVLLNDIVCFQQWNFICERELTSK